MKYVLTKNIKLSQSKCELKSVIESGFIRGRESKSTKAYPLVENKPTSGWVITGSVNNAALMSREFIWCGQVLLEGATIHDNVILSRMVFLRCSGSSQIVLVSENSTMYKEAVEASKNDHLMGLEIGSIYRTNTSSYSVDQMYIGELLKFKSSYKVLEAQIRRKRVGKRSSRFPYATYVSNPKSILTIDSSGVSKVGENRNFKRPGVYQNVNEASYLSLPVILYEKDEQIKEATYEFTSLSEAIEKAAKIVIDNRKFLIQTDRVALASNIINLVIDGVEFRAILNETRNHPKRVFINKGKEYEDLDSLIANNNSGNKVSAGDYISVSMPVNDHYRRLSDGDGVIKRWIQINSTTTYDFVRIEVSEFEDIEQILAGRNYKWTINVVEFYDLEGELNFVSLP